MTSCQIVIERQPSVHELRAINLSVVYEMELDGLSISLFTHPKHKRNPFL